VANPEGRAKAPRPGKDPPAEMEKGAPMGAHFVIRVIIRDVLIRPPRQP
jgi:hypothetical protein